MSTTRSAPSWLASAYNKEYLGHVLRVLAEREIKREIARGASRQQPNGQKHYKASGQREQPMLKSVSPVQTEHYSVKIGASRANQDQNRYYQLEPYDRTRVVVPTAQRVPTPDRGSGNESQANGVGRYLNASWVLEKFGHKWWIASQAPLPQTANTFFGLILQPITRPPSPPLTSTNTPYILSEKTRIRTVVQLTKNFEGGRTKADAYFPTAAGKFIVIPADLESHSPALKVTLLKTEEIEDAHCIKSTISVVPVLNPPSHNGRAYDYMEIEEDADSKGTDQGHGEQRDAMAIFTHLFYTSWPDHGVPEAEDRISLVNFLHLADRINRDTSLSAYPPQRNVTDNILDPDPPIIVGCSAGVGRTGSFIALSSLLRYLGELPPPAVVTPSSVIPSSPLGPLPEQFQDDLVAQEIDSLREQRQRMVERSEQVLLIYEILVDLFRAS